MVKLFVLTGAILALGACEKYQQPIKMKPHGSAVRHNMAAQIIDPRPPQNRPELTDANRGILTVEAYQKNEVADPAPEGTSAKTTDAAN